MICGAARSPARPCWSRQPDRKLRAPLSLARARLHKRRKDESRGRSMRAVSKAFLIGAALASAPLSAGAQPAAKAPAAGGLGADVRCLITMVALSQQKDRGQAGQMGVYFYAGRISARGRVDLAGAMRAEAGSLNPNVE